MAKDEAKVETTDQGETIGNGNDARLKMYAQINDQNDTVLAQNGDLADVNDDNTTSPFNLDANMTDEEIAARELQRATDEANQQGDTTTAPADEPVRHKIKVNGRELELTTEELIERAQKVEAAETYLSEAARIKREAEQQALQAQHTQQQPSHEDVAAALREEQRALVRAIQMGTEEEAMAAIEKLQARNTPSVQADEITRAVDERITFNDAVTKFQTEFKDIVGDSTLLNVVLQRDKELLASGDKRGYWERYQEIGKQVRDWRDSLVKAATPADTKPEPDKQTRKASATAVPAAASTKAPQAADEEEQDESMSDVIAAMAKARGGPQWLRG